MLELISERVSFHLQQTYSKWAKNWLDKTLPSFFLLISMHPCFCVDMIVYLLRRHPHSHTTCAKYRFPINAQTPVMNWQPVYFLHNDSNAGFRKTWLSGGKKKQLRDTSFWKENKNHFKISMLPTRRAGVKGYSGTRGAQHVYFQMTHSECHSKIVVLFMQQAFSSEREKQSAWAVLLCHQLRCRI